MRVKVRLEFLSGVSQGSALGPLLFFIFINDLPQWIRDSMVLLFAGDTKIYRNIMEVKDARLHTICHLREKELEET